MRTELIVRKWSILLQFTGYTPKFSCGWEAVGRYIPRRHTQKFAGVRQWKLPRGISVLKYLMGLQWARNWIPAWSWNTIFGSSCWLTVSHSWRSELPRRFSTNTVLVQDVWCSLSMGAMLNLLINITKLKCHRLAVPVLEGRIGLLTLFLVYHHC